MADYDKSKQALDYERSRRSAHHFIFNEHPGGYLVTKDEHDKDHAVKPFPDALYLKSLIDCLMVSGKFITPKEAIYALEAGHSLAWLAQAYQSGIFAIEKSRQMMITWIICAFILWRAKFHPHQLILVQSKREDDAANLVFNKDPYNARISFMEYHLPDHLKTIDWEGKHGSFCNIYFPNGSHIWAIPEGADIIRSNTPSMIYCDEAAFQPEFGDSYTAALPAVKGGGQYVGVSTANPGAFQELVEGGQN
jgi:hypothetical protein